MPTALRESFSLLMALDLRDPEETLKPKLIDFLAAARQLASETNRELTNGVMRFCMEARELEQKGTKLPTATGIGRPTALPDNMWGGLDGMAKPQRYRSPHGPVADDGWGSRAFQRDFIAQLDAFLVRARSEHGLADELKTVAGEIAGSIMVMKRKPFLEKLLNESIPANETIAALQTSGPLSPEVLKIFATEFAKPRGLPLRNAWGALARRLQSAPSPVSPETLAEVTAWAKNGVPCEVSELPEAQQMETFRTLEALMRRVTADGLEQAQEIQAYALLARQWESSVRFAHEEPEHEFAKAAASSRLNARELKSIMDAADLIRAEGLQGLTVEVDREPFLWPRIAESLLIGEPRHLMLHGGGPSITSPNASETNLPRIPYFVHRHTHHLPISCSPSVRDLISDEVFAAFRERPSWTAHDQGRINQQPHATTISVSPSLEVSARVKSLLKLSSLPAGSFLITARQQPNHAKPDILAFGVLFHTVLRDIPGFKRHDFGRTLHLFIAHEKRIPSAPPPPQEEPAAIPESNSTLPVTEPTQQSSHPTPRTQRIAAPKKAPIPREPRPVVSEEHALSAKVVLLSIPGIQGKAKESLSLRPTIPFQDASIITTLNILKNGERPGSKGLKELRTYVLDDKNFLDCQHSAELVRTTLKQLLSELLG